LNLFTNRGPWLIGSSRLEPTVYINDEYWVETNKTQIEAACGSWWLAQGVKGLVWPPGFDPGEYGIFVHNAQKYGENALWLKRQIEIIIISWRR
jgi:hypothetical protein